MPKIIFLYTILIFICLRLWSQEEKSFDLSFGEEFIDLNTNYAPTIFGSDGSGYYVFQESISKYFSQNALSIRTAQDATVMRKFDKDLNVLVTKRIILGKGSQSETPLQALGTLDKLHLFSFRQDVGNRSHLLFHRFLNKDDLSFSEEGNLVAEVGYDGFPKYKFPDYHVETSRDSSKILIHYQLPTHKEDYDKFGIHVFNEEMVPLWKDNFTLPYPEENLIIESYRVGDDGRVFVLARYKESKRENAFDHTFKLFVLNPGFEEAGEYELEVEDKPLSNMQIQVEPDGDIICVGSYLIGEGKDRMVRGIFFFRLNGETLEKDLMKIIPYPTEMFQEMAQVDLSKKSERKKSKIMEQLSNDILFQDIILRSDGGLLLIGEEAYSHEVYKSSSSGTGRTGYFVTEYVRNSIVAVSLGPDAQLERFDKVLAKNQKQEAREVMLSYGLAITHDKIRFVFNDRIENELIVKTGFPREYYPSIGMRKKQILSLVTHDQDGNSERESLMSVKDVKMYAFPRHSMQISNNELIILLGIGKRRRLGKLTFK